MRIGIGVTTYNRPDCLKKWKEQIRKHTNINSDDIFCYVADDTDNRKGVAYRKNECLKRLKEYDCDYYFLFDDDCYPIKDGWVDYFIDNSNGEHLLYLNPKQHRYVDELSVIISKVSETNDPFVFNSEGEIKFLNYQIFADCGGVFMFLTKEHIKKVGAFNEEFGLWGFEHAEYSQRVYNKKNYYLQLKDTYKYIFSEDYNDNLFKSSVTNVEKNFLFQKNISKFAQGYKKRYIPL